MFDKINALIIDVQTRKDEILAPRQEGQALVEYGLLVGLIAVGCVAAVTTLGGTIKGYFTSINGAL
jgi:pilus assembly protein Flp/PilA